MIFFYENSWHFHTHTHKVRTRNKINYKNCMYILRSTYNFVPTFRKRIGQYTSNLKNQILNGIPNLSTMCQMIYKKKLSTSKWMNDVAWYTLNSIKKKQYNPNNLIFICKYSKYMANANLSKIPNFLKSVLNRINTCNGNDLCMCQFVCCTIYSLKTYDFSTKYQLTAHSSCFWCSRFLFMQWIWISDELPV